VYLGEKKHRPSEYTLKTCRFFSTTVKRIYYENQYRRTPTNYNIYYVHRFKSSPENPDVTLPVWLFGRSMRRLWCNRVHPKNISHPNNEFLRVYISIPRWLKNTNWSRRVRTYLTERTCQTHDAIKLTIIECTRVYQWLRFRKSKNGFIPRRFFFCIIIVIIKSSRVVYHNEMQSTPKRTLFSSITR
jgi:hypothetical protein